MQNNWVDHLPMAKFAANNHINVLTKRTTFFADNGFHFCTDIEPPQAYQSANRKVELLTTDKIMANQEKMAIFLQDQLAWAPQK